MRHSSLSARILDVKTSSYVATVISVSTLLGRVHGRPHIGANGVSWPSGKMNEKRKSENMQKEQFSMFMLYFESNRGRQM